MSLRIRSISRLTGIREATLRAWERRYGFPRPQRSENGYRTYSSEDVEALQRVARLLEEGYAVSEAISEAKVARLNPSGLETQRQRFLKAAAVLDAEAAERALTEVGRMLPALAFCDTFLLPLLREMTERLDVGQEHLASALVRQRLRNLVAEAGGTPQGPTVVLACPPEDLHEGGLLAVALHLRLGGWRVSVLGADTPVEAMGAACAAAGADLLALSCVRSRRPGELQALLEQVVRACGVPVVAGGPCARAAVAEVRAAGALYAEAPEELHEVLRRRSSSRA